MTAAFCLSAPDALISALSEKNTCILGSVGGMWCSVVGRKSVPGGRAILRGPTPLEVELVVRSARDVHKPAVASWTSKTAQYPPESLIALKACF